MSLYSWVTEVPVWSGRRDYGYRCGVGFLFYFTTTFVSALTYSQSAISVFFKVSPSPLPGRSSFRVKKKLDGTAD